MVYMKMTKWTERWLEIANNFASWSKDPSTKVGAVIVDGNRLVSQGYNGFPAGLPDASEDYKNRELKYDSIIHAEVNAIFNAAKNGARVQGATIFVSGLPVCSQCANAIIQSGISEVVYDTEPSERWRESTERALEKFKKAGVRVVFARKVNE